MRRAWRGSPLNGVVRKRRTISSASSCECIRAPMAMTFASLCWRPSLAVSKLYASAARAPTTLFAAICSPLPDPPITMHKEPESATTASAAGMQKTG